MIRQTAANSLWFMAMLAESRRFQRALNNIDATQEIVLRRTLQRNADTAFGGQHGFSAIRSVADFQRRVPLSTYDDYRPDIDRIAGGEPNVLTAEPVLLLEETSGSTAATKLIPYTASLKTEFQRAIAPWMVNLFRHDPALLSGQAYWSVSPVTQRNRRSPGGIPIGFEEDSDYFGRWQRHLVQAVQAVPPLVKLIDNIETFRYLTLLFLLRSRRLGLISVWNPTFLTLLVNPLSTWWMQLAQDIGQGTISPPYPLSADLQSDFARLNRPDPRRAAEIAKVVEGHADPGEIHARLWPHLRLLSCWTESHAKLSLPDIVRLFPQARIQGKGLLATEGVISFPWAGFDGALPAIRSHFLEFLPEDGGEPRLVHQLKKGAVYEVVMTTGGGLYRYRLHDLVEVTGHLGDCPLLRFAGKAAHISDWFGEKLNERHVQTTLDRLFEMYSLSPGFAMLACEAWPDEHAYTLFIQTSAEVPPDLGATLDVMLQENFHYRYCRSLEQLGEVRIVPVGQDAPEIYQAVCRGFGQRAGDIKPVALHRKSGWRKAFTAKHGSQKVA